MTAHRQVAQVAHPKLSLLVSGAGLPFFDGMRTQPTRRWAVAILATHPIADIEGLGAHFGCNRKRVAGKAFLVLVRRRLQVQNFPNAEGTIIRQHLVGASMFILPSPD